MRYRVVKAFLVVFALLVGTVAVAQNNNDKPIDPVSKMPSQRQSPKVTTEFGLGVGARYNWFETVPISSQFTPKLTMPVSFGAALQFRLNIGKTFGIQPEISYARAKIKITDKTNDFSTKAKSNIVQIPMLLSFRIAMFRINFGPVFTLMDEATYQLADTADESIKQMQLGKMYPAVTYTAGISVKFAGVMMIDVRYADQFMDRKKESYNQYIWTLDQSKQAEAQSFFTRCRSVQLRFGVVF